MKLQEWEKTQEKLNDKLAYSCRDGLIENVKYLLTSKELDIHAEINHNMCYPLKFACSNNRLDIVKYLLTSPELKEKADIHADNDGALNFACANKDTQEIINYLLCSPDLKENANFEIRKESHFSNALKFKNLYLLKLYIFDFNIEQSKEIKKMLKKTPNPEVENLFKLRDLNKKLTIEWNDYNNKPVINKMKI